MDATISTPRGTILIRPAQADDALGYRELRLEALQNNPTAFSADYAVALARPTSYWSERIAHDDENAPITYFAVHDRRLIGTATIVRGNSPKTKHSADLVGMYVQVDWRGLGITDAIVAACVDWARALEIKIVKLAVVTTNARAIRAYARCGFTVYGIEPQALYYDEVYYDELLMVRRI